jgi:hypothetical protein
MRMHSGLAMAKFERMSSDFVELLIKFDLIDFLYLPVLIDKVEKISEENVLHNDSIVMRMTGCLNSCARLYVAGKPILLIL